MSHELDIAYWLFGAWVSLTALGGQFSNLEIDSDDIYSIIMHTKRCPLVNIHMNYLDRTPKREIIINTESSTIFADLIQNKIEINGVSQFVISDLNETYISEHKAMLTNDNQSLCSVCDAIETVLTIEAAEKASKNRIWINKNI